MKHTTQAPLKDRVAGSDPGEGCVCECDADEVNKCGKGKKGENGSQ